MDWQVAADMAVAAAVPLGAAVLFAARVISRREVYFLVLGVFIGMIFELFLSFMGPGFISFKMEWPLPREAIFVCHALWDGGLFMGGYALAWLILRRPRGEMCAAFDWRELAIMTAWGAASSVAVELVGNGVMWEYHPQKWNPVWLTAGGRGYTVFIQVVWLVVPAVFYFGCIGISRGMRRLDTHRPPQ